MIAPKPRAMCSVTIKKSLQTRHTSIDACSISLFCPQWSLSLNECGSQVKTVNIAEKGAVYLLKKNKTKKTLTIVLAWFDKTLASFTWPHDPVVVSAMRDGHLKDKAKLHDFSIYIYCQNLYFNTVFDPFSKLRKYLWKHKMRFMRSSVFSVTLNNVTVH